MAYGQSGSFTVNGSQANNYNYPVTLNVGASTKCLVAVTGWLYVGGAALSGVNQTYPAVKAVGGIDPGPQSYGSYFPSTPPGNTYATTEYTWVTNVVPNGNYQFGCNIRPTTTNTNAYCSAAVSCF
jgi:hypothetical protein